MPSRPKAMTSAALLEGNTVVRTKAQIAPVTELEMMFEEPRPYVEIPRLRPVWGDPGRDQNGFRLALAQVDALVARLAIVREPHEFIPAAERYAETAVRISEALGLVAVALFILIGWACDAVSFDLHAIAASRPHRAGTTRS